MTSKINLDNMVEANDLYFNNTKYMEEEYLIVRRIIQAQVNNAFKDSINKLIAKYQVCKCALSISELWGMPRHWSVHDFISLVKACIRDAVDKFDSAIFDIESDAFQNIGCIQVMKIYIKVNDINTKDLKLV